MGMFSWKCKGCGHELIEGESVRLNGAQQEYNGYGGSAAASENYEPSAWHNRCFLKVSQAERLDESPSASAPDQGFGPKKLEFLDGYDENKPTIYSVVVFTDYFSDREHDRFELYYTNNGKLEDDLEYRKRLDDISETLTISEMDDWNSWKLLSEDQQEKIYADHKQKCEAALGGKQPCQNGKEFLTIDEAIAAVEVFLPGVFGKGCLPAKVNGNYQMVVYGKQDKIEGAVYERTVYNLEVKEAYRINNAAESNVKDKLALAVKRFLEVEKEYEDASAALGRAVEPFMKTDDIEALNELSDAMPKRWRGNRRIYEQIHHLEGAKK